MTARPGPAGTTTHRVLVMPRHGGAGTTAHPAPTSHVPVHHLEVRCRILVWEGSGGVEWSVNPRTPPSRAHSPSRTHLAIIPPIWGIKAGLRRFDGVIG